MPPIIRRIGNRLAKTHLERARTALSGARFEGFHRQLEAFAALSPASTDRRLDEFARSELGKRHDKVVHRGRRLGSLDERRLHRLRIAIKKLRYAADFLRPAFASPLAKPYIEATVRLQGALGALNDRAVAAHVLADLATAARPLGGRGPAAQGPRQAGGIRQQTPPPQARAGLEGRSGRPGASGGTRARRIRESRMNS